MRRATVRPRRAQADAAAPGSSPQENWYPEGESPRDAILSPATEYLAHVGEKQAKRLVRLVRRAFEAWLEARTAADGTVTTYELTGALSPLIPRQVPASKAKAWQCEQGVEDYVSLAFRLLLRGDPIFGVALEAHGFLAVFSAVGFIDGDDAHPRSLMRLNAALSRALIAELFDPAANARVIRSERARAERESFKEDALRYWNENSRAKAVEVALHLQALGYTQTIKTLLQKLKGLKPHPRQLSR